MEWEGKRAVWGKDGEAPVREWRMCAGVSSENVCAVGIVRQMIQGEGSSSGDDTRELGGGLHELEQCGRKVDGMHWCCVCKVDLP